jgi:hypothetical protein
MQSSRGIYAAHLWEGSKEVDGGGSFVKTERSPNGGGEVVKRQRGAKEFQTVAVDIFGQATPADGVTRDFNSLVDLQTHPQDPPFANGNDVEIFYLTKATSCVGHGVKCTTFVC